MAASVDAWALGVMALELLTGAPAFRIVTDGIVHVRPSAVLQVLTCLPINLQVVALKAETSFSF